MKFYSSVITVFVLGSLAACSSRNDRGYSGVMTTPVPVDGTDSGTNVDPNLGVDGSVDGMPGIITKQCAGEDLLSVEDNDATKAALAMGLCPVKGDGSGDDWGLVSARYTMPDGSGSMAAISHGLLDAFGDNVVPRAGSHMLALSSGAARSPDDVGYESPAGLDTGTTGNPPPGFPVEFAGCGGGIFDDLGGDDDTVYNGAALEIKVRAPANAKSVRFNVNFYTYEFPDWVCSSFNDFFIALQSPAPAGAKSGNIAFDSMGNPISVNNAFVEVCEAQSAGGKNFTCSLGSSDLQGTGFEGHAASGWLEVVSPVEPGQEFTLRFAVWDVGDEQLDSTALIDNLRFDVDETAGPIISPI